MEWTGLNDLREAYLHFFETKEHMRLPSYPLVPSNDNSLLLINSGMAPMKKFFMGEVTPPSKRVTTCQKCIRTPDIENVGKTARHGTFFEMMGNFSFGDYFKREAINWAWEFSTEVIKLPIDKVYVTVFDDDQEAYDIWTKEIGVAPERVSHLGREDNFWEHGSGPCGPCSELYFDRGEKYGCGNPDCAPGCDCDRFVEYWNLVFTQFESDGKGHYELIDHPNIDTGMGLERLATIVQGVDNIFEVDTIQNILKATAELAGIEYKKNEKQDVSLRVITDHIRSTVFMVGDGVLPSNEGRGYVLRRLLRRAARHGRLLGIREPFLYKIADVVIDDSKEAYPNLQESREYIEKIILAEEKRFGKTIDQGMDMLEDMLAGLEEVHDTSLSGESAFKLYDTYGFPFDLTKEIAEERGITIDGPLFEKLMNEQRVRAREARLAQSGSSWAGDLIPSTNVETEFVGYDQLVVDTEVLDIFEDGELVDMVTEDTDCILVLKTTPFYAEGGGEVGDRGEIYSGTGKMVVQTCKKSAAGFYLHYGYMEGGYLKKGDQVTASVDEKIRRNITKNHTGVHMLQAALREVLGDHVHQAGSYVDDHRLRFDFTHFEAVTPGELAQVEQLVNEKIMECLPVVPTILPIDEAKNKGAIALFGEKYGDTVRMLEVGDFSTELCGGCHVSNSGELGLLQIISEASVAAGVRRIEATTGFGVLNLIQHQKSMLLLAGRMLKIQSPEDLPQRIEAILQEEKAKEKEIRSLQDRLADRIYKQMKPDVQEVSGVKVAMASFANENMDILRAAAFQYKESIDDGVCIITNVTDGKGTILVTCGKDAVKKGVHAGKVVKEIATIAGGGGGGKPDNAMAGIKDPSKLPEALEAAPGIIAKTVDA